MKVTKQKSESVSQREAATVDERVRRTRMRIDEAFVELLHRRPYGRIRVSDITKKAHVGRPTFYAHYSGKDALLKSQFERRVAPMLKVGGEGPMLDATALFAHVGSAPVLYKAMMGAEGGSATRVIRECFVARAGQAVATAPGTVDPAIAARFVASTLVTLIESWLELGAKESPAELQVTFEQLTRAVVAAKKAQG